MRLTERNPELQHREVDVWLISCEAQARLDSLFDLLSPEERIRADRFHREVDRIRFRTTHIATRMILARYVNARPKELIFAYSPSAKPELADPFKSSEIHFNLSHSSEMALLAIARGALVGVDIEWINPDTRIDEIAEQFFSPAEVAVLTMLPEDQQVEAFFSCWTQKEAYIKARGDGLSLPLDSFDVAFGMQRSPALVAMRLNPSEVARWSMYDIEVPAGYKAALAVEGSGHRVRQLRWTYDGSK